uniref:RING-CH-type domain-containing protein n=1 Tax=Chromera velia CCMP2878 TaxID=1169474 RepID=A0A0G4HC67_9ALVE|eukprot:Cvel_6279.t1-p1 / transcript=Cvel_6279.t1 / gene=Cvel_6279 / organism=Chromera_velia_CCMP2878 / gene_product=hypothetical protein / transcript_product=hypothetical protein / location=Cvel_scaffold305:727-6656(+) / protein_length=1318 / sequence_SO=supercontig / SO=protein_coding / is_pseudo=false
MLDTENRGDLSPSVKTNDASIPGESRRGGTTQSKSSQKGKRRQPPSSALEVSVQTSTWINESHGLFDYEAAPRDQVKQNFSFVSEGIDEKEVYRVYRIGSRISVTKGLKLPGNSGGSSGRIRCLLQISRNGDGELFVSPPERHARVITPAQIGSAPGTAQRSRSASQSHTPSALVRETANAASSRPSQSGSKAPQQNSALAVEEEALESAAAEFVAAANAAAAAASSSSSSAAAAGRHAGGAQSGASSSSALPPGVRAGPSSSSSSAQGGGAGLPLPLHEAAPGPTRSLMLAEAPAPSRLDSVGTERHSVPLAHPKGLSVRGSGRDKDREKDQSSAGAAGAGAIGVSFSSSSAAAGAASSTVNVPLASSRRNDHEFSALVVPPAPPASAASARPSSGPLQRGSFPPFPPGLSSAEPSGEQMAEEIPPVPVPGELELAREITGRTETMPVHRRNSRPSLSSFLWRSGENAPERTPAPSPTDEEAGDHVGDGGGEHHLSIHQEYEVPLSLVAVHMPVRQDRHGGRRKTIGGRNHKGNIYTHVALRGEHPNTTMPPSLGVHTGSAATAGLSTSAGGSALGRSRSAEPLQAPKTEREKGLANRQKSLPSDKGSSAEILIAPATHPLEGDPSPSVPFRPGLTKRPAVTIPSPPRFSSAASAEPRHPEALKEGGARDGSSSAREAVSVSASHRRDPVFEPGPLRRARSEDRPEHASPLPLPPRRVEIGGDNDPTPAALASIAETPEPPASLQHPHPDSQHVSAHAHHQQQQQQQQGGAGRHATPPSHSRASSRGGAGLDTEHAAGTGVGGGLADRLWIVVNSLPKKRVFLSTDDVVKLGRHRLRVKDVVMSDTQPRSLDVNTGIVRQPPPSSLHLQRQTSGHSGLGAASSSSRNHGGGNGPVSLRHALGMDRDRDASHQSEGEAREGSLRFHRDAEERERRDSPPPELPRSSSENLTARLSGSRSFTPGAGGRERERLHQEFSGASPSPTDAEPPACRICLGDEDTPECPLIAPCRCAGSMQWVHLPCLRHWVRGRLNIPIQVRNAAANNERNGEEEGEAADVDMAEEVLGEGTTFTDARAFCWRPLNCELCKTPYPTMVECYGRTLELLHIPRPRAPYIVFESAVRAPNGQRNTDGSLSLQRHLYFLSFHEKDQIKVGRAHDALLRLPDISISRHHATLRVETRDSQGRPRDTGRVLASEGLTEGALGARHQREYRQEMNRQAAAAVASGHPEGLAVHLELVERGSKFGSLIASKGPVKVPKNAAISIQVGRTVIRIGSRPQRFFGRHTFRLRQLFCGCNNEDLMEDADDLEVTVERQQRVAT